MIRLIILWKDRKPGEVCCYEGVDEALSLVGDYLSNPFVKKVVVIPGGAA